MSEVGLGSGLAALGFWSFIAITVAAGVWDGVRRREIRHATLRSLVDSGQPLDDALIDRVLALGGRDALALARDLRVGAWVMFGLAAGLLLMGGVFGLVLAPVLLPVLAGVAGLVLCLGAGFGLASRGVLRFGTEEAANPSGRVLR